MRLVVGNSTGSWMAIWNNKSQTTRATEDSGRALINEKTPKLHISVLRFHRARTAIRETSLFPFENNILYSTIRIVCYIKHDLVASYLCDDSVCGAVRQQKLYDRNVAGSFGRIRKFKSELFTNETQSTPTCENVFLSAALRRRCPIRSTSSMWGRDNNKITYDQLTEASFFFPKHSDRTLDACLQICSMCDFPGD